MIIYVFCQGYNKKPAGGVKVLFDIVDTLNKNGLKSKLLIPGGEFNPEWFNHSIEIENVFENVTKDDCVIFHEETLWAFDRIIDYSKCKYGILNQGAHWSLTNYLGYQRTYEIYQNASFILVNSNYTGNLVSKLFNRWDYHKFTLPVDDCFVPSNTKQNRICYMPRRNSETAELIAQYVKGKFNDWEVYAIDGINYTQVAQVLGSSKIFLSFGGPEGFGLPPLEAALCGCRVIGYDGYGGSEFFVEPLFKKITFMEVIPFMNEIEDSVERLKYYSPLSTAEQAQLNQLRSLYSKENFTKDIINAFNALYSSKYV